MLFMEQRVVYVVDAFQRVKMAALYSQNIMRIIDAF